MFQHKYGEDSQILHRALGLLRCQYCSPHRLTLARIFVVPFLLRKKNTGNNEVVSKSKITWSVRSFSSCKSPKRCNLVDDLNVLLSCLVSNFLPANKLCVYKRWKSNFNDLIQDICFTLGLKFVAFLLQDFKNIGSAHPLFKSGDILQRCFVPYLRKSTPNDQNQLHSKRATKSAHLASFNVSKELF